MSDLTPHGGVGTGNGRAGSGAGDGAARVPPGRMTRAPEQELGPAFMSLEEFLGAARRNLWIIVVTTAIGFGATYWWLSNEVQLYQSGAFIRLMDTRSTLTSGIAGGIEPGAAGRGADPVQSEIMVLKGRDVMGRVVDQEGLRLVDATTYVQPSWVSDVEVTLPDDVMRSLNVEFGAETVTVREVPRSELDSPLDPSALPVPGSLEAESTEPGRRMTTAYGSPVELDGVRFTVLRAVEGVPTTQLLVLTRRTAADFVSAVVVATARSGTDGIDVLVTSRNPSLAPRIANSVVQNYQAVDLEIGQGERALRRAFLEGLLREQDSLLAAAQAGLAAFRAQRQMFSSEERLQAQQSYMLQMETRQRELESNRRLYLTLRENLDEPESWAGDYAALASAPGIGDNPLVSSYYGQLVGYQIARDSMATGPSSRTPLHGAVQRLDSLIASTEARLETVIDMQIAALDDQIAQLTSLREESAAGMREPLDAEAQEGRLERRVEGVEQFAGQIRSDLLRARVDEAVEGGQVEIVDLAAGAFPISPRRTHKLMLGAMAGLLLGLAIGFFREAADRTLVRKEDVERVLHLTPLAVIPRIGPNGRFALANGANGRDQLGRTRRVLASRSRNGHDGMQLVADVAGLEAYRTLRTNLIFSPGAPLMRTVVVTSAAPEEGKTITVANLGLAFARQGARVIMVDSDLRRPDLARLVGLPRSPGLTEVLLGEAEAQEAIRRTGIEGLDILPSGLLPDNTSELLGGRRMQQLLDRLGERYDLVLLDSPPVLATADAAVLGALADGVLLVARAGRTDRRAARQVVDQLERVGARVIGCVLNDPDAKVPRYGGDYGYRYSYGRRPEDATVGT